MKLDGIATTEHELIGIVTLTVRRISIQPARQTESPGIIGRVGNTRIVIIDICRTRRKIVANSPGVVCDGAYDPVLRLINQAI